MPRITKSKPVTLVLDQDSYIIPAVPVLRSIALTIENMARYMTQGLPEQSESVTWACNLGRLAGAGKMDLVGDLLDGTQARAAWDLDGQGRGLSAAMHLLPGESSTCANAFLRGFNEVTDLMVHGYTEVK